MELTRLQRNEVLVLNAQRQDAVKRLLALGIQATKALDGHKKVIAWEIQETEAAIVSIDEKLKEFTLLTT